MKRNGEMDSYFHRVWTQWGTQFWINSAVQTELEFALLHGAKGITTNPTHPPKAIKADGSMWHPVIDEMVGLYPELTDDEIADRVTQQMAIRSVRMLSGIFDESGGKYGYVAIQGNPLTNGDLRQVVEEAKRYNNLGENIAVKVQSTQVGAQAVEELTALGINTICTNGFSVAQGMAMAEAYERGLKRAGSSPRCFVVHIAGIFDEYLEETARARNLSVSEECLLNAGVIVTRRLYRTMKERRCKAILLAGGSRAPRHFTDLVGGDLAITISYSHARELVEANPPVISGIDAESPAKMVKELESSFPDFNLACYADALKPEDFVEFGPCRKFQQLCEEGYRATLKEIRTRRGLLLERRSNR
jgi:transaldolase